MPSAPNEKAVLASPGEVYFARGAVEGDPVALLDDGVAYLDGPGLVVDVEFAGTRYAALAHAACYHGRVRGHTAACGQDTFGRVHAAQVLGRGFDAHQNHVFAVTVPFGGLLCEEDHLTGRCAGRCGKPLGEYLGVFHRRGVEYRVEQFVTENGRLLVDESFGEHVHRDLQHGGAGALAVARLEHPQLAVLYGEFEVLHVGEIALQVLLYVEQFLVGGRHHLFQ